MDDFAPGLPSREDYGDLSKLKPGQIHDLVVQLHLAQRSGKHFDYRIGSKNTGLYSWATKKELTKPGEKRGLFHQPLHSYEYKDFQGDIKEGYGKGSVKLHELGKVLITKVTP